jgi:hypothetical protein
MARAMRKIPGAVYDVNADKWLLPNTREYDAFMSQQTQAQNPFASGAYEVMYGGGGGAAFDAMDGGGFFQEQDETQAYYQGILSQVMEASRQGVETFSGAYSRLGEVPPEMRPLPSEELVAYRSQSEEIAPEEREAFREYLRRNPRGTFTEFRDPRAFVSIQGGSLEQLDPNTPSAFSAMPSAFSALSSASTASGGAFRVHGNLGRKDTEATKKKKSDAKIAAYGREKAAPYVIESVLKRVDKFIEARELGTM